MSVSEGFFPMFKGSECPCRFFALRARHTTRRQGPVHHRPAGDRGGPQRTARPLAHLSINLLYAPLLTPVASRNFLLYQSLPTSIQHRHANARRRKDDTCVGTAT